MAKNIGTSMAESLANYVVLDEDLTQLKQNFNDHKGKLRLFFIVGPTCGICLRGMTDLQDEFLRDMQNDPRLQTFVVHVPALEAEESDVSSAIPLMQGPRITHYWDGVGHTGLDFQKALGIDVYAWDVWMIYGPEATWESGSLPSIPEFWQHQLGHVNQASRLDKAVFAQQVKRLIASVAVASE